MQDLLAAKKPIFLISMKRPAAMSKVNDLLGRIDKTKLKAFIIDDEGDQASLNTKKNKAKARMQLVNATWETSDGVLWSHCVLEDAIAHEIELMDKEITNEGVEVE